MTPTPERDGGDAGVVVPREARLVVISPHLDDAALGCGDLLAAHPGAVVVTAFAGRPARYPGLTSWDARAGFTDGDDVVAARREEDRRALTVLGARPCWLDFPDSQYGEKPSRSALADALAGALDELRPDVVALPLGLFHDDHILTSDAALAVARRRPDRAAWLAYADAIYRRVPNLLVERLAALERTELGLASVTAPGHSARGARALKRRAVACYASQLRALAVSWDGGHADAFEPEQYWWIVPAPGRPATGSAAPAAGGAAAGPREERR